MCSKQQMRAGTHVNLIFWCKSRCFACTKRQVRSGIHRDSYTGPKVAVLHAKTTDEGWDPERLVNQVLFTLFCMHKTTGYVWDPERPVFMLLITLICMTGEVWVPNRLVILLQKSLFCMQKPQKRAGTHRDKLFWG